MFCENVCCPPCSMFVCQREHTCNLAWFGHVFCKRIFLRLCFCCRPPVNIVFRSRYYMHIRLAWLRSFKRTYVVKTFVVTNTHCFVYRHEPACNPAWHGYVFCKRKCFVKLLVSPLHIVFTPTSHSMVMVLKCACFLKMSVATNKN